MQEGKFFKTSGLFHITPDFNNKMRLQGKKSDSLVREDDEGAEGILPSSSKKTVDDHDIKTYSSHWWAGPKHYDYGNTEAKCNNRFLLYGM